MVRTGKIDFDVPDDLDLRLSFGESPQTVSPKRRVIAHHLVITGYGHWLPNDIRGSGSAEIKQDKLEQLGPIHYGRKQHQPSKQEIRAFFRKAEPLLEFERIWFDHAKRQAIAEAFSGVIRRHYTVWACAICKNHAHLCIRANRHTSEMMWTLLTDASRKAVRAFDDVDSQHEIWTRAPYTVFLHTPDEIRDRIGYINQNPVKEGLPPQSWPFVRAYDGWPLHRQAK